MKKVKILSVLLVLCSWACDSEYTPKPKGYFRIDVPKPKYQEFNEDCNYRFEYNQSANLKSKGRCWYDIKYPSLRATVQLTYREVSPTNLDTLLAEGHQLAYKHTVKADGIQEKLFLNDEKRVYGLFYQLQGDAATSMQFFMTDSTNHFLRGVLYYYASPNADSLRPVNHFMQGEMIRMIESLEWKN